MSDGRAPRPGYWAVLPTAVRYDDRIPASAKVLYAELSALAEADGYCWAGNDYFAKVFQMTEKSIREQLHALDEAGYIRIEEERGNHHVLLTRRIYVGLNPLFHAAEPLNEKVPPLNEKVQGLLIKENNKPPISPTTPTKDPIREAIVTASGEDEELLRAWLDFAEMRRLKRTPIKTLRTVELTARKLEQLSRGDREVKIAVLQQSVENSWTGLFALKSQARETSHSGSYWADDPYD